MAKLGSWGLDRVIRSRLHDAVTTLDGVVRSDSYGSTRDELEVTLDAIHLCADFFQVAASLPDEPIGPAVSELAISLQGSLTGTNAARRAREYLSQYWVGTLLTLANVEPRILPEGLESKRPDFLLDLGGLDCAIEVKRPESFNSMRDALDRAAGQLRSFGRPGVICLDLTDCICIPGFATGFIDCPIPIAGRVAPVFKCKTEVLADRPSYYNQSDKYARVIALVLFARIAGWRAIPDLQPEAKYLLQLPTYPNACQGLVTDFTERLKRLVLTGFERMTGSESQPL